MASEGDSALKVLEELRQELSQRDFRLLFRSLAALLTSTYAKL